MFHRALPFLIVLIFSRSVAAFAGGDGGNNPPRPQPLPPQIDLCNGFYRGCLLSQPGLLTLELRRTDDRSGNTVTAFWNGQSWMGQGFCQQTAPSQAEVQFQFIGTNIQRGIINYDTSSGVATFNGQVFNGDSYRLYRQL
jgi:hypothetical protein